MHQEKLKSSSHEYDPAYREEEAMLEASVLIVEGRVSAVVVS